jgi:metal-sulfur cluster biosynthetic enzyme
MNRVAVLQALQPVQDPELGVSIVDLGLVRDVRITPSEESTTAVDVTLAMTSPLCPLGDQIAREAQEALSDRFVEVEVHVAVDLDAKWSPDDMTEAARSALGW